MWDRWSAQGKPATASVTLVRYLVSRRKVPPIISGELARQLGLKVRRSMTLWKNYYLAQDLPDVFEKLTAAPGPVRFVAGGTDILLDMQQGRQAPVDTLIDVSAVPEMNRLEIVGNQLIIGASVPLNRLIGKVPSTSLVYQHAQALHEACSLIGGPQVRNTATLGGNVAHALPAGDGTIALLALDAQVEIANPAGNRWESIQNLFLGPGKSSLASGYDVLVSFSFPLRKPGQGSVHRRVMRPQGVAIAILNMAVWMERSGEMINQVRIAVGPAGPTPFRAQHAEQVLTAQNYRPEIIRAAQEALLAEAHFRTSPHRATAEYRQHLAGVLLNETLQVVWARAATP